MINLDIAAFQDFKVSGSSSSMLAGISPEAIATEK